LLQLDEVGIIPKKRDLQLGDLLLRQKVEVCGIEIMHSPIKWKLQWRIDMLNMKNKKQMRFVLIFMLPYFISVGGTVIIGFLIGGYSNVQYRYVLGITPLAGIMLSILGRAIADKYYPNKK
jgi:hypothetical protein